ncbi:glycerophosphodiester phosphodiesterase GDPD6 [Artemisia annua]|uniref:glycerophosphodiester phosphodiesterase n=1 Tax=Artemisia annua TaxID=35608 RepID=A0A2U1LS03_ARTAN|nr:glycerophosphodiester phosphodiesterase GDPD6 [Artemisia annua]
MSSSSCTIFCFVLLFIGCSARRLYPLPNENGSTKKPLQTFRPFNVAHRGSNGEIPEETTPAYLVHFLFNPLPSQRKAFSDLFMFKHVDVNVLVQFSVSHHYPLNIYSYGCTIFCFVLLFIGCSARRLYPLPNENGSTKKPLQTFRPFNVAHRGSNGEIPEETTPAYLVHFLFNPLPSQRKAFSDLFMFKHVDVNVLVQFSLITDYIIIATSSRNRLVDFTLKELKTLRTKQRFESRDQQYNGKYPLITFEEYIQIAIDASRVVGIYPEIKNPVLINQRVKWPKGKRFEDVLVETLKKYGYKGSYLTKEWLRQPCFIQSFAPSSLVHIHNKTDLPKIFLIDDVNVTTQDTNQTYAEITSDHYFDYIKEYVVGIGPWTDTIVPVKDNYILTPTDLVARAHTHNLQVHPYTFRNENKYLPFNFSLDPYMEYDYWINTIGVDGLFTDFTGSLHHYQEWTSQSPTY